MTWLNSLFPPPVLLSLFAGSVRGSERIKEVVITSLSWRETMWIKLGVSSEIICVYKILMLLDPFGVREWREVENQADKFA